MADVVSLGSVNVDLFASVDETSIKELSARYEWFPSPDETRAVASVPSAVGEYVNGTFLGGKGSNQAVAAAKAGVDAAFCGRVGTDHETYGVLETLSTRGVDTAGTEVADAETGKAYVFVDEAGENRIAIVAGANATVDESYVDRHWETIRDADCLLLQNEIPMATMEATLASLADVSDRPTVLFDPAPAEGAAPLLEYEAVDVVTPNAYEYERLGDAIGEFAGTVIRTRGSGTLVVERRATGEEFTAPPPEVTPVDTTGAGDVFDGYLAARLAAGDPLPAAVTAAVTAASLATTHEGAQQATPSLAVVRDFMD